MDYESLLRVKKALQGWAGLVTKEEATDSKQKQGTKVQAAQKETPSVQFSRSVMSDSS